MVRVVEMLLPIILRSDFLFTVLTGTLHERQRIVFSLSWDAKTWYKVSQPTCLLGMFVHLSNYCNIPNISDDIRGGAEGYQVWSYPFTKICRLYATRLMSTYLYQLVWHTV